MKVTYALLALVLVSTTTSDYYLYHEGRYNERTDFFLLSYSYSMTFDADHKKYVVEFNTCNEYSNLKITLFALDQFDGKPITVKKLYGGAGSSMAGIEVSGDEGVYKFELKMWGQWFHVKGHIDEDKAITIGAERKDCKPET